MQLLVENGDISFKDKSESHIRLFVTPWTYTVYGILRARILERVAFPFSRGSSQPRGQTQILHCRQILYQLSHKGKPRILEWVGYPFSSRSSQPRTWTGISCIASGYFTNWAIREAMVCLACFNRFTLKIIKLQSDTWWSWACLVFYFLFLKLYQYIFVLSKYAFVASHL